jgi:hypothetical protein
MNVQSTFKRIQLHKNEQYGLVLGNFGVTAMNITPAFPHTGYWYEYFTGDSLQVTDVNAPLNFAAGEYHLYTDQKMLNPDFIDTTWTTHPLPTSGFSNVYPNPSSGEIDAGINTGLKTETPVTFEVYNSIGQRVESFSENILGSAVVRIDGRGYVFTTGVFLLKIKTDGNHALHKIVIR